MGDIVAFPPPAKPKAKPRPGAELAALVIDRAGGNIYDAARELIDARAFIEQLHRRAMERRVIAPCDTDGGPSAA